jgi:hypothetical protein
VINEGKVDRLEKRLQELAPPAQVTVNLDGLPLLMGALESVPCECGSRVDAREWVKRQLAEGDCSDKIGGLRTLMGALESVPCECGRTVDARDWVRDKLTEGTGGDAPAKQADVTRPASTPGHSADAPNVSA